MAAITVFLISLIPGLLWVWFFYRQDRFDKEPVSLILLVFLAGMAAVVPAALAEFPFRGLLVNPPTPLHRLVLSIGIVGLVEEGFKLLAVYWTAFRRRAFNQAVDGIIYAVTASLGFAALENAMYTAAFGFGIAPVRAVVASLAHASFGGVAGLHLGFARVRDDVGVPAVFWGLALAAGLHGVYDFVIVGGLVHPLFALLMVYLTYRFIAGRIRALGAVVD